MKRAAGRSAFRAVLAAALLSLLLPPASADRGTADFSAWNRTQIFRNPFGGSTSVSETILHLGFVQNITNYGTVTLWADGLFSRDGFKAARLFAGWRGFKFDETTLTVGAGDDFFVNSNLDSRFVNQYHPYFYFRGLSASLEGPDFDLSAFGGKMARLTGLLGSAYELKDQPFYGLRGRWKFSPEGLAGAGVVYTRGDPSDPEGFEKNTLLLADAEVPVAAGAKVLGEFRTSLTPGESGEAGSANALRFGPLFQRDRWDVEANYRFTGSRFFDLNPDYQFLRDERGFFTSVRYRASRNLSFFGIADRFSDNTDGDPGKNTLRALMVVTGFYLNTRSLFDLSAQGEFLRRDSESALPGSVDFSSSALFLQASRTLGDYYPYLRVRLQSSRESAGAPRTGTPVVYLGFRKMMSRGSFLWVEGQWDRKKREPEGLIDRNLYLRSGLSYVFSPDFDIYTELFYERYGVAAPASQLVAYLGVRFGLTRDLDVRADIRLSEPLNRRDVRSSDTQFTLRLDKRFSWGREPKIMGRKTVGAVIGVGGVDGHVFEDRNADGVMNPGEKGLPGVFLRLEDGSRAETGDDGRFRFPMVAEGPHQLRVEENLIPATYYLLGPSRVNILVQARVTRQVLFPLISGATLTGRFIEDADRNGKADPSEKGLADVLVILTPVGGIKTDSGLGGLVLNTYTGPDGAYRFVNILPGDYELSVDPETLPEFATVSAEFPLKVRLEPGRTTAGLDFLVAPRPVIKKK